MAGTMSCMMLPAVASVKLAPGQCQASRAAAKAAVTGSLAYLDCMQNGNADEGCGGLLCQCGGHLGDEQAGHQHVIGHLLSMSAAQKPCQLLHYAAKEVQGMQSPFCTFWVHAARPTVRDLKANAARVMPLCVPCAVTDEYSRFRDTRARQHM